MNSKNKFSCPECGAPVYAWVEQTIEHRSAIDPKTGRFKRIKKVSVGNRTSNSGVTCSKCEWGTYAGDQDIPDHFTKGLAGEGFDALAESADQCDCSRKD